MFFGLGNWLIVPRGQEQIRLHLELFTISKA